MSYYENLMSVQIAKDTALGDILSVDFLVGVVGHVVLAATILIVGFFVAGAVRRRIVRLAERSEHFDVTLGRFLANLARYGILAVTVIFVLQQFGFQTTSLVALLGAAGLAIGLALQGVLGGVASGVMLVVFRPIKIGDFVEVNGLSGTVKDISIFTTELATIDNVQLIVPNTDVWSNAIKNFSVYDTRRAEWVFGVSYSADLKKTESILRDVILGDPRTLSDPAPFLQVNNLGESSVDFLVRVWVPASDYFQFQADMKRAVKEAFDAGGIEIPFPSRTIYEVRDPS